MTHRQSKQWTQSSSIPSLAGSGRCCSFCLFTLGHSPVLSRHLLALAGVGLSAFLLLDTVQFYPVTCWLWPGLVFLPFYSWTQSSSIPSLAGSGRGWSFCLFTLGHSPVLSRHLLALAGVGLSVFLLLDTVQFYPVTCWLWPGLFFLPFYS